MNGIIKIKNGLMFSIKQIVHKNKNIIRNYAGKPSGVTTISDIEKEKKRLIKESEKLDKEVNMLNKKLQNENFLSKADPLVIEETRSKLNLAKKSEEKVLDFIKSIEV